MAAIGIRQNADSELVRSTFTTQTEADAFDVGIRTEAQNDFGLRRHTSGEGLFVKNKIAPHMCTLALAAGDRLRDFRQPADDLVEGQGVMTHPHPRCVIDGIRDGG